MQRQRRISPPSLRHKTKKAQHQKKPPNNPKPPTNKKPKSPKALLNLHVNFKCSNQHSDSLGILEMRTRGTAQSGKLETGNLENFLSACCQYEKREIAKATTTNPAPPQNQQQNPNTHMKTTEARVEDVQNHFYQSCWCGR